MMLDDVGAAVKPVEDTRTRILAATRLTYAEKGSRGTTTREVAERAGVNEATLFRHFGTKQQLLTAMIDHYTIESSTSPVYESLREGGPIDEQLCRLGLAAVEAISRKEDLIKVGMAEEIVNPESSVCVWRAPVEARRRLAEFMNEKIVAGDLRGDPLTLARVFMSLFFAYVMARKLWGDDRISTEQAVASMVDIFLNGARAS